MDTSTTDQPQSGPFTQAEQMAPQKVGPFQSALQPNDGPAPSNRYDENQTGMTATLASLAQQKYGMAAPGTNSDQLDSLVSANKALIEGGKEKILRSQIGAAQKDEITQMWQKMGNDIASAKPPDYTYNGVGLGHVVNAQLDAQAAAPSPNALESEGIRQAQAMAAQDPDQAAMLEQVKNEEARGGLLEMAHDQATKISIFNRELNALLKEHSDEPWYYKVNDVADQILTMGFGHFFAATGNVEGGAGVELTDLPSTRINKEASTLWGMPVDKFAEAVPAVFNNFQLTHFGAGVNLTQAVEVANQYARGGLNDSDSLEYNWALGLNAATFIPVASAFRTASKAARLLGNRVGSADMVAQTFLRDAHGAPAQSLGTIQPASHSIEESLPSSLVPSTADLLRADVGVVSDVAQKIEATRKATQAAARVIASTERLSPEQVEAAIQNTVKHVQLAYKDENIVDMKQAFDKLPNWEPFEPDQFQPPVIGGPETYNDPEADLDNLSWTNARGEVYREPPREFRTNPAAIQREHDLMLEEPIADAQRDFNITAYHGTASQFEQFSPKFLGAATSAWDAKQGAYFFTDNPHVASGYASFAATSPEKLASHEFAAEELHTGDFEGRGSNVRPQALSLHNPLEIDYKGATYSESKFVKMVNQAKKAGNDGLIVHNVDDDVAPAGKKTSTVYAVFSPDQIKSTLENVATSSRVAPEYGHLGGIRSVPTVSKNIDSGVYSLNFYLGKKYTTGGFLTQEGAEAAAQRRGFDLQDVGIHQNSDGQWFIKVKQPVTENGIVQPSLRASDLAGVRNGNANWFGFLRSMDQLNPEDFNIDRVNATIGKSAFMNKVIKPWARNIQNLSRKSVKSVAKVLEAGEREQKWYNLAEFQHTFERASGRLPSDKETLAYYSAKELSDINYNIFNNSLYAQKATRGMATVRVTNPVSGFDTGRTNGRVVADPDFDQLRVFDAEDSNHYPPGTNTAALKQKLSTGKYKVIELETVHHTPGNDPVRYVVAHDNDSLVAPLTKEQLGYVEGGSRENRYKWFVKQADSGQFADGGRYWTRPITHIASPTKIAGQRWAAAMEEARQAYINPGLSESQKRLLIDKSPVESYDKFEQMISDGKINLDHPFETLFDRENPRAMSHVGDSDSRWFNTDETANEGYVISKGRMYYSGKGEHLRDPHNELASILDPFTTLNKSINNAVQTRAFGNYNQRVIGEWARMATPYLDRSSTNGSYDAYNVFFNGRLSQDLLRSDPNFYNQLETVRNTHKRFLDFKSPEQSWTYLAARRFGDWVESKGQFGEKLAEIAYDKMSSNPVSAVKGMAFDAHIGLFNPARLWLHTQNAAAAITQHPVFGLRSASMLPVMTHLMINRSENLLDFYAHNTSFLHELEPGDFKDMIRAYRNSGWLDVSGEQANLDQYMNSVGGSALARGLTTVRDWGRILQNLSERFNRTTAYQMAWMKMRQELPDLAGTDPIFQARVNRETDNLNNNMTSSSQAFWQKGPASVPTQFLANQARLIERILPKTFGGSAQVSAGAKVRLFLGQLMLFGTTGMPVVSGLYSYINDQYARAHQGQPIPPDVARAFGRGIYDTSLHILSGGKIDTDISSRASLNTYTTDLVQKLTDGKMNSVLSVLGGPAGGFLGDTSDTLGKLFTYVRAEQIGSIDSEQWTLYANDMFHEISSVNQLNKAYWIWKTGQLRDPQTGEPIAQMDKLNAIPEGLGIPSFPEVNRWDIAARNQDREEQIRDIGKMVAGLRRKAFDAIVDGDEQKALYYNTIASGVLQPYHDDPLFMSQAAEEANKELSRGGFSYDNLVRQTIQKTGQKPLGAQ